MEWVHYYTTTHVWVNESCELFPELPLGQCWLIGSSLPLPSYPPPPSFSRYHPCMSLISFFLPSLLIFESLQLSPLPQIYRTTPPLSTLPPYCCSILLVTITYILSYSVLEACRTFWKLMKIGRVLWNLLEKLLH
jgi:hypothetical protein